MSGGQGKTCRAAQAQDTAFAAQKTSPSRREMKPTTTSDSSQRSFERLQPPQSKSAKSPMHGAGSHGPQLRRPKHRGYDNLHIFLISLLIIMETNISMLGRANQHVDVGAEIDEDEPQALTLRLLLFVSVNHSYLMPLLFLLYGRLSQEGASQPGDIIEPGKKPLHPRPHMRLLCRRILPAIVCQLSLQRLQRVAIQQANFDTSSYESSTASPIVLFPLLLSAFDFTVSTIVERMGQARAAVYLEQFQAGRRRIVPVYWTMLVQMDTIVAAVFPLNVLSESAFRLTDIPQYFFAYIWGRLSVTTGSIHVMAILAPISMPILCLAVSVFFSNVALLDLALAIPGLSQRDFLTESVQSSPARMGSGFSQPAIIYRVWKQLSFASIAPALLEIFRQNPDEDIWVTIPGV